MCILLRMKNDFLLCDGLNCPLKDNCYRFIIEPNKNSEFLGDAPYDKNNNYCSFFLKIPFLDEEYIRTKAYYLWIKGGCRDDKTLENWYMAKKEVIEELKKIMKKEYHSRFDIIVKDK